MLIDEAYVDFARYNCMDLALRLKNVLVMRTLSKSFSLAGIRLGYAIGDEKLIAALYKIKDSYNLDRMTQAVALAALSDIPYMRSNVKKIRATRKRLCGELADLGFKVYHSDSNFVWVKPCGVNAKGLYKKLRENKVLIRYFPGRRTGEFVRITVGTDKEIDVLLKVLKKGK